MDDNRPRRPHGAHRPRTPSSWSPTRQYHSGAARRGPAARARRAGPLSPPGAQSTLGGRSRPSAAMHPDISDGAQVLALALPLRRRRERRPRARCHAGTMDAIEEALHDADFDEIILSTLPHSVSLAAPGPAAPRRAPRPSAHDGDRGGEKRPRREPATRGPSVTSRRVINRKTSRAPGVRPGRRSSCRRSSPSPPDLRAGLRQEVPDRCTERPGQDVGHPKREHRVQLQPVVRDRDERDHAAEEPIDPAYPTSRRSAERSPAAVPSAKVNSSAPVEGLALGGEDRVDRQRALAGEPDREHEGQDEARRRAVRRRTARPRSGRSGCR